MAVLVATPGCDSAERAGVPASRGDIIERACRLSPNELETILRGHRDDRSEDVTFVPHGENYLGSFDIVSHSGPSDHLQRVPLVVYGRNRIPTTGAAPRSGVTLADVYPTVERLVDVDLGARPGSVLEEVADAPPRGPPQLLVFVMWDGVGRNVLARWPESWPNLARLEREGVSYTETTVGSSPSITPSTHATLGTGAFPNEHGITGIQYRRGAKIVKAFERQDPTDLMLPTFADQVDALYDNEAKVGVLGLRIWHVPMLGHGGAIAGGDKDEVAILGATGRVATNREFFAKPRGLRGVAGPGLEVAQLDAEDGVLDEEWLGHEIRADQDNPAWVRFQHRMMIEMLRSGGYGADEVPDLFFVNVKMTDIVGHKYSMDSPEMEQVLRAQDESLGGLVEYLEEEVGDFVLVLSADHGHTPSPRTSGAWPIQQRELEADLDEAFDVPVGTSLTQATTAVGPFLDEQVMRDHDVTLWDIAAYLNGYTIADNWDGELPNGYEERGGENVFDAAFPSDEIDEVIACARG